MLSRPLQNLPSKYSFIEEIYTGVSSKVILVIDTSGNEYALKLFNKNIDSELFEAVANRQRHGHVAGYQTCRPVVQMCVGELVVGGTEVGIAYVIHPVV